MSNPCKEEEVVFFDTKDHLADEEEIVRSLQHGIWLSEPQSIAVRREMFLSRMGFLDHFESHEVESSAITESAEAESSYSESSSGSIYDSLLCERRESNSEADCSVDYSYQEWLHEDMSITDMEMETDENAGKKSEAKRNWRKQNNVINLWRQITRRLKKKTVHSSTKEAKSPGTMARMRVEKNQKRCMELTGLFSGQELKAHSGLIWTMKFSQDGQYLASGGEDGVVCIWRARSKDASCSTNGCILGSRDEKKETFRTKIKHDDRSSIVVPDKIFHIEEEPLHKFHGHTSDVLDLAWSSSNYLLSSSMDKTVRLWKVGSDRCLRVFQHVNYVTCVQFNPIDENYFVSGSIDGKVRIWGIRKGRVEDWANVRDIVTAVCYQPNGEGFVVGSVSGICRSYDLSAGELVLKSEIKVHRKKKSSGNRIASIQFLSGDPQRLMITSDDSKIYVLEDFEVVCKYKGLGGRSQISAASSSSSSSNGKHILSVGADSRVYLYNHDDSHAQSSKQAKTIRSFEHFSSEGATVALPWSDSDTISSDDSPLAISRQEPLSKTTERFSLASWLSMDGSFRGSLTWPEEKLPPFQQDFVPCSDDRLDYCCRHRRQVENGLKCMPPTWGLVFVTAHRDGSIRTFHNYGLPLRT